MRFRTRVVLVPLLLLTMAAPLHAQRRTAQSVEALARWVDAVNTHVPGRADGPVARIAAMPYSARRELNPSYSLFARVLRDGRPTATRSDVDEKISRLAGDVLLNPGASEFLRRAAILHFDALVFASKFPKPKDDAPPSPRIDPTAAGRSRSRANPVPPLLANDRVILTRDGQIIGDGPADWNLPFARSLLDELLGIPPVTLEDRDFVGQWYHAVAAYLFAMGMNGDAPAHLQHAERVLPDDPRLLFDRGSFAETLGLPIYQAVQQEVTANRDAFSGGIPAEDQTNAVAEQLYRRALERDPSFVEARVRLARLIDRRGRHDDAAAEIGKALETHPTGDVGFYAHIIGGRIASARGRYDEALQHYRNASSFYPDAQSALIGASHAALMLADVPQTLAPLAQFGDGGAKSDPWWDYQLGAGRDINAIMAALWARRTP